MYIRDGKIFREEKEILKEIERMFNKGIGFEGDLGVNYGYKKAIQNILSLKNVEIKGVTDIELTYPKK